jgi:N-acetylneuraminic acid mutarotase
MKSLLSFIVLLLFCISAYSQSPQAFQYQSVLRSADGNPIANADVELKISILSDTAQSLIEYSEIQNTITDSFGRVNLKVGDGEVTFGDFAGINWGLGQYFIRIEFDPSGGSVYQLLGQTQLLSVPYALYANHSGDEIVAGQGIEISDNIISNTGDLSDENELQSISKFGNAIMLSQGGGSVTDNDVQSLTQTVAGTTRQIRISNGNSIDIDVADNDNDPSNELQVITISNDTIYLSNGGFAKLPPPTNAMVPNGGCIQSNNPDPPQGYAYSGTGFTAGDQWNNLPPMSNARFAPAVAAVGNKIYVIGGWDGVSTVSKSLEVYDITTQTWSQKANITTGVVYAASAVIGNTIHVMGGYNGSSTVTNHQVYNTSSNSWSQSASLLSPRSGCGAAVVSGKIYLIGGYYNGNPLSTNQMYNPSTNSWTNKTSMTTARTDFAIAALNDGIYVIGGWDTDALNVNEFYYPATDTWTTYYPMPSYRSGCACAVANDKIYVIAGGDAYSYISSTEEYDPINNNWLTKAAIPASRSYSGAAVLNDKIYVVGGNFGVALNTFLVYDPATVQYYIHCAE